MKKYKSLVCIVVAVLMVLLVLAGCAPKRSEEGGFETYTLSNVVMTQKGINTYNFDFDVDSGSEEVKVYFTERDRIRDTDTALTVVNTPNGDNAHISFALDLLLGEEYYLWVIGSKQVVLPITAPSMFPNLSQSGSVYKLSFGYTFNVSWSSFCDPTGKAIYVSDKTVFDNTATAVSQNMNITVEDYTLPTFEANKYYYTVTTAKNGLLKIISAPITLSNDVFNQIDDIAVELVNGTTNMKVTVKPKADSNLADTQAQDLQVFVKNNIGDEIYSVRASYDNGTAVYLFDCTQLIIAGNWYDVCFAYRGAMLGDVPWRRDGKDVVKNSSVTSASGIKYNLTGWSEDNVDDNKILKVYYEYAPTSADGLCNYSVFFDAQTEELVVTITKIFDNNVVPILAITGGSTEKILETNYTSNSDGAYVYRLKISSLNEGGKWYDIRLFFGGIVAELSKDAAEQFGQNMTATNGRVYSFQEWDGMLKIMFTE